MTNYALNANGTFDVLNGRRVVFFSTRVPFEPRHAPKS